MIAFCKYHQNKLAYWFCTGCRLKLCSQCLPVPRDHQAQYVCPVCDRPLILTNTVSTAPPFWLNMPLLLRYPLQWNSLFFLILTALLLTIIEQYVQSRIIIISAYILFSALLFRYGFLITLARALSKKKAPAANESVGKNNPIIIKLFTAYTILILVSSLIINGSEVSYALGIGFFCLLFPACTILLALHGRLFFAINPINILGLFFSLGMHYITMILFTSSILAGAYYFIYILTDTLTNSFLVFFLNLLLNFILFYTLILTYTIMGYLIYQNRHKLEYSDEVDQEYSKEDMLLAKAKILVNEGLIERANKYFQHILNADFSNITVKRKYHTLLLAHKEMSLLDEMARNLITSYLNNGMLQDAMEVALSTVEINNDFSLLDPDNKYLIADALLKLNNYEYALQLLTKFGKLHPDYSDKGKVYYLIARIYSEKLHQNRTALSFLNYIITFLPQSDILDEVVEYKTALITTYKDT